MKYVLPSAGGILLLLGLIWFLQGINILPGSVMTGQAFWAWAGVVCIVVGTGLLFVGLQRFGGRG